MKWIALTLFFVAGYELYNGYIFESACCVILGALFFKHLVDVKDGLS